MLVSVSGPDFNWTPQQVVDMEPAEAAKWADGVRGVYVDPPPAAVKEEPVADEPERPVRDPADQPQRAAEPVETTEQPPPAETTTVPRPRGGRRGKNT